MLTLATAALGFGCQPAFQQGPIAAVPRQALATLRTAHHRYVEVLRTPRPRAEYEQALNDVAKRLGAAITQQAPRGRDFVSPLPRSLRADLWLDTAAGADGVVLTRARDEYTRAVDETHGTPEWIPGFVGLARIETRAIAGGRGDPVRVAQWLDRAESELRLLEDAGIGLGEIPIGAPLSYDPERLTERERLQLLVHWLTTYELWVDPYLSGVPGDAIDVMLGQPAPTQLAAATPTLPGRALLNRLRSRIAFQRAELLIAQGAHADRVCDALDAARRWDRDFHPIALEYAVQLRRLDDYQAAESMLQPYLTQAEISPVFTHNARFWQELARIYAGWYRATPTGEVAASAIAAYRRLLDEDAAPPPLDPENRAAWAEFAEFYEALAAAAPEHAAGARASAERCRLRAAALPADPTG